PGNPGTPSYYPRTEPVASFDGTADHDNILAGPYHNGTGLGKLTFICGHSFSTSVPYSNNFEAPYLRAFYNSLFFNGSAVAKIDMVTSPASFPQNGTQPLSASIVNTGGSVASGLQNVTITLQSGVSYVATTLGPAPSSVSGSVITWNNIVDVQGGQTVLTVQLSVDTSITATTGSK